MNGILSAPLVELKELNNLFIELTAKNCNQRCKQCYIDFPINKNIKDFIDVEKIKNALDETKNKNLQCIYLTGAEPMTHPEFNTILRLCLKYTSVCICTNASFINEKKSRFLKKVEDEGNNEIIFMLSLAHFNEIKNDNIRYRGAFRETLNAIKCLIKYDFNPIINFTNYYNEPKEVILEELVKISNNIGFDANLANFKINNFFDKYKKDSSEIKITSENHFDCENSRTLTEKGVYTCPFLANDHRGRMGSNFKDYGKKAFLETSSCKTCFKNKQQMFSIDFSLFC